MTAIGIDVGGTRKGFHGCALRGRQIVAGPERLPDVAAAVDWVRGLDPTTVALNSPRSCAPPGDRSRPDEREFNLAGICRIRWTPEESRLGENPYFGWVQHGLRLYAALAAAGIAPGRLIEVFPTAAWTIWTGPRGARSRAAWSKAGLAALGVADLDLAGLPGRRLNQDDRDAVAAAVVARLHEEGRARAFGEITVPADACPAAACPAAPRRARPSRARPAANRGRQAPDRPG